MPRRRAKAHNGWASPARVDRIRLSKARAGKYLLYGEPGTEDYGSDYLGDIETTELGEWHATYGEAQRRLGSARFPSPRAAADALMVAITKPEERT